MSTLHERIMALTPDVADTNNTNGNTADADGVAEQIAAALLRLPGPVEPGYACLDAVAGFLARFVAFPSPAALDAIVLWIVHTHAFPAAETTPRLAILSAEKRSGKSRTLELLELLCARPRMSMTMSGSVVYRIVESEHPTLLLDEIDTVFTKGRDDRNEDLRGILNAGHRRGAKAYRCGGAKMSEVQSFDAFCPVALAGIGSLPATIEDRSIVIRMRRRASSEPVQRLRRRKVAPQAEALRDRLADWAAANLDALTEAEPELPDELDDRAADGWEPMLALAEAAGSNWPDRARVAAIELSAGKSATEDTIGVRLLADIRGVFGSATRLSSADLVTRLVALEEAPWGALYGGHPLDARGLARRLHAYGVKPHVVRIGGATPRGYDVADFADSWTRYTPETGPDQPSASCGPE